MWFIYLDLWTEIYIYINYTCFLKNKNLPATGPCLSGFSQTETGLVPVPQQGLGNVVKYHKKPLMLLVLNCALGPLQEWVQAVRFCFCFLSPQVFRLIH